MIVTVKKIYKAIKHGYLLKVVSPSLLLFKSQMCELFACISTTSYGVYKGKNGKICSSLVVYQAG